MSDNWFGRKLLISGADLYKPTLVWLYPFSSRAGHAGFYWSVKHGKRVPVCLDSYAELVTSGELVQDPWWWVSRNFRRVQPGDPIFIYTGDEDAGIVGFAFAGNLRVRSDRQGDWYQLRMHLDIPLCQELVTHRPVTAPIVRRWLQDQKGAVEEITPFAKKIDRRLSDIPQYRRLIRRME